MNSPEGNGTSGVTASPENPSTWVVHPLVKVADLAGTFIFGFQGALLALAARLDLFGVLVLSFATALGGGVIRDVLMGSLPPSALRGWSYPCTAFAAGAIAFALEPHMHVPMQLLQILDAFGLALFAVAGTEKALDARIHPLSAVLLGTITAVGGGTIRDLMLTHVPGILRVDIYATAAMFGATLLVLGRRFGLAPTLGALIGGTTCLVLRLVSLWLHWQLPGAVSSP